MLPSQYGSTAGRRVMYRRRRRRLARPLVLVLVAGGIAAGVWAVQGGGLLEPTEASADVGVERSDPPEQAGVASADASEEEAAEREDAARERRSRRSAEGSRRRSPVNLASPAPAERALSRAIERTRGEAERPGQAPVEIAQAPSREENEPDSAADEAPRKAGSRESGDRAGEGAPPAPRLGEATRRAIAEAEQALDRNDPLGARRVLNRALHGAGDARAREELRDRLSELNERLVFSPVVVPEDPIAYGYEVQPGDALSRIVRREGLDIDWRVVQDINGLPAPNRIRVGQTLKLLRGPFHVVVSKRDFRVDLYWGRGDRPEGWTYIRSFPAGLGEHDSTPTGVFRLREDGKLADPAWTNPRTGEKFAADDPDNPIGEYWVGIEGVGEYARHTGYGLHGTIEPESIGDQRSMGCVRLLDDDIRLVFSLLGEDGSYVIIRP